MFNNTTQNPISGILGALKSVFVADSPSCQPKCSSVPDGARHAVLVIDVSGSMYASDWKPSRLGAAKDAARTFAKHLFQTQPNSVVTVVIFACKSKVAGQISSVNDFNKIDLEIERVDLGYSTNMFAGLKTALKMLKGQNQNRQVVLLTDGQSTGKNPDYIATQIKQSAIIECVGIGGSPKDVDEILLKKIASAHPDGQKRYRWIGQKEQLVQHFHNLAGRLMRTNQ